MAQVRYGYKNFYGIVFNSKFGNKIKYWQVFNTAV